VPQPKPKHPFTRLVLRFSLDPEAYAAFVPPNYPRPPGYEEPQFPDNLPDWRTALVKKLVKDINILIDYEYDVENLRQGAGDGFICLTHIGKHWPIVDLKRKRKKR
jgi:hypothetical protein